MHDKAVVPCHPWHQQLYAVHGIELQDNAVIQEFDR